jgi:putative protease
MTEESGEEIGVVTHFYNHIGVGVIKLNRPLKTGEKIKIKGHTTEFEQPVKSMQKDHKSIDKAGKGDEIGLKLEDKVRQQDKVYKV